MRAQGARRDSVALSIAVDHIGGERPLIDRSSPKLTDGSRPHSRRWACSPKSQVAIGETIAIEVRQVQSGVDQDVANFEAALKDAHPRQRPSRRQGRFHAYVEELGKADPQPGRRPPWRVAAGFEAPVPQSPPWLVQQHQLRSAWRAGLPPFPSKLGELALAVVLRAQGCAAAIAFTPRSLPPHLPAPYSAIARSHQSRNEKRGPKAADSKKPMVGKTGIGRVSLRCHAGRVRRPQA